MSSDPPARWQEHWFEHDQLLHLVGTTGHVAIYLDPDGNEDNAGWLLPYLDDVWQYTKQTYGEFGPDPLVYAIFHRAVTEVGIRPPTRTPATTTATSPTAARARTDKATAASTTWSPTRSRTWSRAPTTGVGIPRVPDLGRQQMGGVLHP